MRYVAIVQARMGSSRLPGKVMMRLNDVPIIKIIVDKISNSTKVSNIVIATTNENIDNQLVSYLSHSIPHVSIYRGSEVDVLDRFYQVAKLYDADYIVRITADDPLKDPKIIDRAIAYTIEDNSIDYCSNTLMPTYPEGLDVEVFKFSALEISWSNATKNSEREHVTPYIWGNPQSFNLKNFTSVEDNSHLRWTLDTPEDYIFFENIFKLFPEYILHDSEKLIDFLKRNPGIADLNSGITRNAGYIKSIEKEEK